MILITSISPGHKNFDKQIVAVKSWIKAGYKVVSMNCPEEIKLLKDFKDVEFVPTHRHNEKIFKRPHVIASALIDYLKDRGEEYNLILNSDIIIHDNGNTEKIKELSKSGVVIMNRRDFNVSMDEDTKIFDSGFDGFFINYKYLDIFPQTLLCLGQCFWDYWIPYNVIQAGVKLYKFNEPYLFHQKHNTQYSHANWEKTGEIFRAETGQVKFAKVGQLSDHVFKRIKMSVQ
jgi:hypothetical protein